MSIRDVASWWEAEGDDDRPHAQRSIAQFHREMDKMLDRFFGGYEPLVGKRNGNGKLIPNMDVSETEKELEATFDLPGLDEKDLDVNLTDDVLTIKGKKETEKEKKEKEYHSVERSVGTYYRAIRLPCEVDASKVTARFSKGVLTVNLPKAESAKKKSKKVEVKAA